MKFRITTISLLSFFVTLSSTDAKVVAGVKAIETAAQNISCEGWAAYTGHDCNKDLAAGFRTMLETAISKTGKMDLMERNRMDVVLGEQAMAEHGLTDSGGKMGGLTGIDYIIYGTITKFGSKTKGLNVSTSSGVGSMLGRKTRRVLGGGVKTAKITTEMGVDVKVTDVATGQIIVADYVDGQATQGQAFSAGGISSSSSTADPFAEVQRIVARKISEKIVTSKFPIKVIKVQSDGTLIINYGDVFFKQGDKLSLFKTTGEAFVDPDTGETLGADEILVGTVEVTRTEPRFSRARIIGEHFEVAAGSTLKRLSKEKIDRKRKRSGSKM